jgi:hypothetical protein
VNLDYQRQRLLNQLFALNRRVMKACRLKESLRRLWNYRYDEVLLRYLQSSIDQLRRQLLKPTETLCRLVAGTTWKESRTVPNQDTDGSGRSDERRHQRATPPRPRLSRLELPALEAQRLAATKTEFLIFQKAA